MVEYPVIGAAASLEDLIVGPDGNLWFVDSPNRIGRLTMTGAVKEFVVPRTGPIATGPDRNLWMAVADDQEDSGGEASSIMKITPGGVVKSFPVPFLTPEGITAGPDGNIWFTGYSYAAIGRMTIGGVLLDEFPLPNQDVAALAIANGPDGNVWFIEAASARYAIARITPAGVVTDFPIVQHADADPSAVGVIVVGPDHNMWFTDPAGGFIGRITPAGVIAEFPLGDSGTPQGLMAGPDGNVWFTTTNGPSGSRVGRMSTTGAVRYFALPDSSAEVHGIAVGGDGRIWFTQTTHVASIGEIVPELSFKSRLISLGTLGSPATRSLTITSSGEHGVAISSVKVTGPGAVAITITGDTCAGKTLAVGATCQVELAVALTSAPGVVAAQLRVTDDASGSPQLVNVVAHLPDCRLPVVTGSEEAVLRQGGFLNWRTGAIEPDPKGQFRYDGLYHSKASPTLTGNSPPVYDSIARRWLPAPQWWISPDHKRYTYVTSTALYRSVVHVVDVTTGRDRALKLGAAPWTVLGFGKDGIYMNQSYESIGGGLTVVNPDTGVARQVFATGAVFQVVDGAAWIGANHDPQMENNGVASSYDKVLRRDLATGRTALWFYAKDAELYALSLGGGRILVRGRSGTWLLSGPNKAERLTAPGTGTDFGVSDWASDAYGIWMAGGDGMYLWRPGAGLALVSETAAIPAGACT